MRLKTDKEKEFTDFSATYGIKAFTAQEFDNNKELQKAFSSFVECTDFTVLRDPSKKGETLDMHYIKFFESFGKTRKEIVNYETNSNDIENVVLCTKNLFELHTPIKDISCWEYFDAYTLEHMSLVPFGSQDEIVLLNEKVKSWHKVRREIDKIKLFIAERFPKWSKASVIDKKEYKEDIKKQIFELKILGMDTSALEKVHYFMNNYTGLNQLNKYKADFLLDLELPHINSRKIANKILKNSEF